MPLTVHPLERAIWATAARLSSDAYGTGDRSRFHWHAKDEPRRSHRGFLLPVSSGLGQTAGIRVIAMRRLLLLTALPLITWLPVHAGDLGLNDQKLAGIGDAMQRQQYNQTEFIDAEGTKFVFTKERLTATLSDKRGKWIEEKNIGRLGNINFEDALKDAYITPDQVISFDYFLQKGTGLYFKIFYKARDGSKSLASLQITDENTGKSFDNTFPLWLSNNLDAGNQLQKKLAPAKE